MRHTQFIMPLFTPDIMDYITGREVVCQLVLEESKRKSALAEDTVSIKSMLYAELNFSTGDIIEILLELEKQLKVKFYYGLLLQQDRYFTLEDLATQLWKHMCRVIREN